MCKDLTTDKIYLVAVYISAFICKFCTFEKLFIRIIP